MPGFTPSNMGVSPAVRSTASRTRRFLPGNLLRRLPYAQRRQSARTFTSESANGPAKAVAPLKGSGPR